MLNVGTIICFRVGYNEAQLIARELHCRPEDLQFLEKYHVAYMTPEEMGIAKAPMPPLVRKMEIKRVEPQIKTQGWFDLEPYQPGETLI
jgi:hypothetical protein